MDSVDHHISHPINHRLGKYGSRLDETMTVARPDDTAKRSVLLMRGAPVVS